MSRRLPIAAVMILSVLAGSAHAFYVGPAFGYSSGFWGPTLYVNLGDWNVLEQGVGLRARLGVGLGYFATPTFAAGADVTYDFGRVFNPRTPLRLYLAGGPDLAVGNVIGLAAGFGAGVQYDFPPQISVFFELKPFGIRFLPTIGYNLFLGSGVNFNF